MTKKNKFQPKIVKNSTETFLIDFYDGQVFSLKELKDHIKTKTTKKDINLKFLITPPKYGDDNKISISIIEEEYE